MNSGWATLIAPGLRLGSGNLFHSRRPSLRSSRIAAGSCPAFLFIREEPSVCGEDINALARRFAFANFLTVLTLLDASPTVPRHQIAMGLDITIEYCAA